MSDDQGGVTIPESLSADVRAWIEHWKPAGKHDGQDTQDEILETLLTLASSKASPSSRTTMAQTSQSPVLMQERTTTRKIQILD